MDSILKYDEQIKILIEHKPNEPVDRGFFPTIGHSIALGYRTVDPERVGALLETAHAILAGLDPANEIAFGLSYKKLWSVHLNDQNGLKYDQDKAFGVENLRQAFNQVKVLIENEYDASDNYVGLDVQAMRTQKIEESYMAVDGQRIHTGFWSSIEGYPGCMVELSAAVLRVKLKLIDDWIARRRQIAATYDGLLGKLDVVTPFVSEDVAKRYFDIIG